MSFSNHENMSLTDEHSVLKGLERAKFCFTNQSAGVKGSAIGGHALE